MVTTVLPIWIVPLMKAAVILYVARTDIAWDTLVLPPPIVVFVDVAVLLVLRRCQVESVVKIALVITATMMSIVAASYIVVVIYVHWKTATGNLAKETLTVGIIQVCYVISKFAHGRKTVKIVANSQ